MNKAILPLLVAALMLTGCASGAPPMPAPNLTTPASLTQACPKELPQPASGKEPDLLANHTMAARIYHKCRKTFLGLVKWKEVTDDTAD